MLSEVKCKGLYILLRTCESLFQVLKNFCQLIEKIGKYSIIYIMLLSTYA
jgi:hypothetical protein